MPFLRRRGAVLKAGLIVALGLALLVEQIVFSVASPATRRLSIATPHSFGGRVDRALSQALGPSDRGVQRFRILKMRSTPSGRILTVRWAINSDLSAGSIGNGAQVDAYLAFDRLFSSALRVRRVNLIGTYPSMQRGRVREMVVMRLWMNRKTARLIGRSGWSNLDAPTAWPLIHRVYVAADFQPIQGE